MTANRCVVQPETPRFKKYFLHPLPLIAGILLMMALCEQVHVYEYIPSTRQTDLCHYHEPYYDSACTLGAYHPLLYEKSLIQRFNTGTESDLRRKGRVTLPGLSTVDCGAADSTKP